MRTVQEIRDHVRGYIELDPEDLPDFLIDTWIKEGVQRIAMKRRDWPGYETTTEFMSVADQSDYDLGLREVVQVSGPSGPLKMLGSPSAEGHYNTLGSHSPGEPEAWSMWGSQLRLWPTPNDAYTFVVRGYRLPESIVGAGAGAVPDLPHPNADELLVDWCLYRMLLHQDDDAMAPILRVQFEEGLELLADYETSVPTYQPLVMGGGYEQTFVGIPRFPWE